MEFVIGWLYILFSCVMGGIAVTEFFKSPSLGKDAKVADIIMAICIFVVAVIGAPVMAAILAAGRYSMRHEIAAKKRELMKERVSESVNLALTLHGEAMEERQKRHKWDLEEFDAKVAKIPVPPIYPSREDWMTALHVMAREEDWAWQHKQASRSKAERERKRAERHQKSLLDGNHRDMQDVIPDRCPACAAVVMRAREEGLKDELIAEYDHKGGYIPPIYRF